jgi:hypothetical protein
MSSEASAPINAPVSLKGDHRGCTGGHPPGRPEVCRKRGDREREYRHVDPTEVDTDIHCPTDSIFLFDGVRIVTRWLTERKEHLSQPPPKSVERPSEGDEHERHDDQPQENGYKRKNLRGASFTIAHLVKGYAGVVSSNSPATGHLSPPASLPESLTDAVGIPSKAINQTERRAFKGEKGYRTEPKVSSLAAPLP